MTDDELPEWSRDVIQQISQLGDLGSNWDSYGGKPIDPYCAMAAIQLVLTVRDSSIPSPAVVPLNNGGIQLEWHQRGVDLEIAVHSPIHLLDIRLSWTRGRVKKSSIGPLLDMLARFADSDQEEGDDE